MRLPVSTSPVWRNRDYRRLLTASTVSAFGTDISLTAFPFVAILELDATPWDIGLLQIARMAPAFVLGLFAGAWVDRVARRPVMMACDWIRAVVLITIPVAALLDALSLLHLFVAAALLAVATTFFDIADRSMLPSLVDREEILDANRGLTAGKTVAEATGFAASGWLVQLLSAPGAIVIDALTYVWSGLVLRRIERTEEPPARTEEREPILREIASGLAFVTRNAVLMPLGLAVFLLGLSIQIIGAVYLLYVSQELGFSPGVLGVIFATGGLFSLLASVVAGRALLTFGAGPLLIGALLLLAAGQSLTALATGMSVFAVAVMLTQQALDLPWSLFEMTQVSARQSVTPDAWQGRMNGSFHALEFGGYLVGSIAGGWLGTEFGLRKTIVIGAIGIGCAALPIALSPLRRMHAFPKPEDPPAAF